MDRVLDAWRSVVWVHVSSGKKHIFISAYLVSPSTFSLSPQVLLCALISPQRKAQVCLVLSWNGKQLNFVWFSPNAINHLGLTCCTVQAYGGQENFSVEQEGISNSGSYCSHKKKRLFTWLHSAAFIWRLELFFRLQPALCQNPGVQNEGFPCFNMGKLTGALTYHRSSWFRKGGEGAVVVVWRQAVLFHCWHFYCAVLCNAVGKAAKADSLGRFCMGPHQLHSLIASLTSPCPEVVPCPQGSLLGITRHLAHLVLFHLASILFSH